MSWFSALMKRKMGAVFLSVVFVAFSAVSAHATAIGFSNINALLVYNVEGLAGLGVKAKFKPGFGKGDWDGNLELTHEEGNAAAFATTDFDPLGIILPEPLETPAGIAETGVLGGMLLSASTLSLADTPGFAAAAAASVGTIKFKNRLPFDVEVNFTLLVNATIAGGSFGPTSIGNEEFAFAGVAIGGFTKGFEEEDSGFLKAGFDFAPPDFLHSTFETHEFGIVKKSFTRTLGAREKGKITIGVAAASAAKATPEPGTIILLGTGLLGVGVWKLRKKKSQVQ